MNKITYWFLNPVSVRNVSFCYDYIHKQCTSKYNPPCQSSKTNNIYFHIWYSTKHWFFPRFRFHSASWLSFNHLATTSHGIQKNSKFKSQPLVPCRIVTHLALSLEGFEMTKKAHEWFGKNTIIDDRWNHADDANAPRCCFYRNHTFMQTIFPVTPNPVPRIAPNLFSFSRFSLVRLTFTDMLDWKV